LAVLNVLARHCDSAISKTINLPQGSTAEDVSKVFMYCWKNSIKGITVYVDQSRKDQPISWDTSTNTIPSSESKEEDDLEEEWDDGDIEVIEVFRSPKERPVGGLNATVYPLKFNPMQPTLWITISEFEDEPFELFFSINNNMYQELLDGLSRSVTSSWRRGEWLIHLFKDYCKYESTSGGSFFEYAPGKRTYIKSILHGVGLIVLEHFNVLGLLDAERILIPASNASAPVMEEQYHEPPIKGNKCPNCGEYMVFKFTSCPTCQMCGYSECG
jgi:ribonucleoside-diphosphate reductase alpha chain